MSWWWLDILLHLIVGYPVYQILGTIRHELAHVIAYRLSGYGIKEMRVFPFRDKDGEWYWGRVMPETKPGARNNVHMHLAPYYACALSIAAFVAIYFNARECSLAEISRRDYNVILAITMSMLVSPLVDTAYNLYKCVRLGRGDFKRAVEYLRLH